MRATLATIVVLLIAVSAAWSAPRMGRYNILVDVHGYNNNGTVLLPLRGLEEWLGATTEFNKGVITIVDGSCSVRLKVGARTATVNGKTVTLQSPARVYVGISCVPLRFVGEALGCEVKYRSGQATEYLVYINHVVVARGKDRATVLAHGASPDLVAGIIAGAAAEMPGDTLGRDYLVRVSKVVNGWAATWEPWWFDDDDMGFSAKGTNSIYRRTGNRWVQRFTTSRISSPAADYQQAGIPLSVVRSLGWEDAIEDY